MRNQINKIIFPLYDAIRMTTCTVVYTEWTSWSLGGANNGLFHFPCS